MSKEKVVIQGVTFRGNAQGAIRINRSDLDFDISSNTFSDNGKTEIDIIAANSVVAEANKFELAKISKKPKRYFSGFSFAKGDDLEK